MLTEHRWSHWSQAPFVWAALLCACGVARAQVCDAVISELYNQSIDIERQIDATRYVRRAVLRNTAHGDYVLEFTVQRTDLADTRERWTVTFERDEEFEYVRHLEIDAVWIHTFKTRVVQGKRHVTIETPGMSVEISRDDQPGEPLFESFRALAAETSEHRAIASSVMGNFPHWDYPPLTCVADCLTNVEMCGDIPDCAPPYNPTVCDCWDAYKCCMSEKLQWHLCGSNCICTFCYDGFVEECCTRMDMVQRSVQFECEQAFLACLISPNLLPCTQN